MFQHVSLIESYVRVWCVRETTNQPTKPNDKTHARFLSLLTVDTSFFLLLLFLLCESVRVCVLKPCLDCSTVAAVSLEQNSKKGDERESTGTTIVYTRHYTTRRLTVRVGANNHNSPTVCSSCCVWLPLSHSLLVSFSKIKKCDECGPPPKLPGPRIHHGSFTRRGTGVGTLSRSFLP